MSENLKITQLPLAGIVQAGDVAAISRGGENFKIDLSTISPPSGVLVGEIKMWPMPLIPVGYFVADGRALDIDDEATLFAVLGYYYGGIGQNFNLPDYRGLFVRGTTLDSTQNFDPDIAIRQEPQGSPGNPNNPGSLQIDDIKAHNHEEFNAGSFISEFGSGSEQVATEPGAKTVSVTARTGVNAISGLDTRPRNKYVTYIIKN